MKHTAKVTTVLALIAQFISKGGFYYCTAAFYAILIGKKYGLSLNNREFAIRASDLLDTWREGENGQNERID